MLRKTAALAALVVASSASAQWSVVQYDDGQGFVHLCCHSGTALGGVYDGLPAYWPSEAPGSLILYSVPGNVGGVYGMNSAHQVGTLWVYPNSDAYMWSGSSNGVNLAPAGVSASVGFAISDTVIGGSASPDLLIGHACLWDVNSHAFTDLQPAGSSYNQSWVMSVTDGQQVGYISWPTGPIHTHAVEWYGTANSFVDLNPGIADGSEAISTDGSKTFGWIYSSTGGYRTGYWTGTPGSWTDTTPPMIGGVELYATDGSHFLESTGIYPNQRLLYWSQGDGFVADLTPVIVGLGDVPIFQHESPTNPNGCIWGNPGEIDIAVNTWKAPGGAYNRAMRSEERRVGKE